MITVPTVYIDNIKTIIILNKDIENTKDRWIGDNNSGFEDSIAKHFRGNFKL